MTRHRWDFSQQQEEAHGNERRAPDKVEIDPRKTPSPTKS
jgi:hypothetical protein